MIDVVYTSEEMALLIEAAEHFHRYGRGYSGSYFEGVDTAALAETCGDLLVAWRAAASPSKRSWFGWIVAPLSKLRKRPAVRVDRVDGGFHVVADDRFVDLTSSGLFQLRHTTKYELVSYYENGSPEVQYRYDDRAEVDHDRVALITAVIAKSWPDRTKGASDDFELAEPTDQERAETREAFAQLDRLVDVDVVRRQVEQLEAERAGRERK
jgi:hypothetical protein